MCVEAAKKYHDKVSSSSSSQACILCCDDGHYGVLLAQFSPLPSFSASGRGLLFSFFFFFFAAANTPAPDHLVLVSLQAGTPDIHQLICRQA